MGKSSYRADFDKPGIYIYIEQNVHKTQQQQQQPGLWSKYGIFVCY